MDHRKFFWLLLLLLLIFCACVSVRVFSNWLHSFSLCDTLWSRTDIGFYILYHLIYRERVSIKDKCVCRMSQGQIFIESFILSKSIAISLNRWSFYQAFLWKSAYLLLLHINYMCKLCECVYLLQKTMAFLRLKINWYENEKKQHNTHQLENKWIVVYFCVSRELVPISHNFISFIFSIMFLWAHSSHTERES